MAVDLHFICPHQLHWRRVSDTQFETGNWTLSDETAREALGGRVYLHEKQRALAWHGGTIVAWRPADEAGRMVLTYIVDGPFRVLCRDGWGQEKAIIRRPRASGDPGQAADRMG